MRTRGKVSPSRVAQMLNVHRNTVYKWCKQAVSGKPTVLTKVTQNELTGYYWVELSEVLAVQKRQKAT